MGIEITAPSPPPTPGALLYVSLARALAAMSLGERMQLLSAFQSGVHFTALPEKFRALLNAVASTVVTPPPPGKPW